MNKVDVLWVAGHGGLDPGAVSGNYREKDFTLRMAKRCHEIALSKGLTSVLARSTDVACPVEKANEIVLANKPKIAAHLHINAGGGTGYEIYHALRHNSKLAQAIAKELEKAGNVPHGGKGVRTRESLTRSGKDYYGAMYSGASEPLIIEYDYIDNPTRIKLLAAKEEAYCQATVQGICNHLGVKPKAVPKEDVIDRLAKCVTMDVEYWKAVLNGKVAPSPNHLRILLERLEQKLK